MTSDVEASDTESQQNEVYEDRNLAGMALVVAMEEKGQPAGWYLDRDNDGWPVVWAALPGGLGEVSWHVPPDRLPLLSESSLENTTPPGGYDGYTREAKNERLSRYIVGQLPNADHSGRMPERMDSPECLDDVLGGLD